MCTMYAVKIFALQWQIKVHSPSTKCHDIISHVFHNCVLCYGMRFKKYAMRLSAMIWYLYTMLWQIDTKGSMMCCCVFVCVKVHIREISPPCIIYLIIHQNILTCFIDQFNSWMNIQMCVKLYIFKMYLSLWTSKNISSFLKQILILNGENNTHIIIYAGFFLYKCIFSPSTA